LKAYKERLIVFPRKPKHPKKSDSSVSHKFSPLSHTFAKCYFIAGGLESCYHPHFPLTGSSTCGATTQNHG
jgi:hypothetical protein